MKVFCAWHPKYFLSEKLVIEKEPLNDHSENHDGLCDACLEVFKVEVDEFKRLMNDPTLSKLGNPVKAPRA